jgi:hypothetical protein
MKMQLETRRRKTGKFPLQWQFAALAPLEQGHFGFQLHSLVPDIIYRFPTSFALYRRCALQIKLDTDRLELPMQHDGLSENDVNKVGTRRRKKGKIPL